MRSDRAAGALAIALLLSTPRADAGPSAPVSAGPEPIHYRLTFPHAAQHYVEVEATFPSSDRSALDLMMAVWTPGSYLVREFSRHVEAVTARTPEGRALAVDKTRKNHWQVRTEGARTVVVSYRVYARELGVRTNFVERDFGFLNGAPTFLTRVDSLARPHHVRIELPAGWGRAITPLDAVAVAIPAVHTLLFRAPDFDTLVDSPILLGNPVVHEFEVDGKPHVLANEGEAGVWDGPRSAADVEKLVREYRRMWGFLPYPRYAFLNVLAEAGGGLEHKNATLMLTSRFKTRTRKGYLDWLGLVSHEFLHAWNVKRLRPIELGPFDYEDEVYTRSLWIAEGITSYYQDLAVRRAGLSTDVEFLRSFSEDVEKLQTSPGRLVQSLEASSFDAWIKEYRPDENSKNTAISYYTKGAVVGFLLDARIRQATAGAKSLDDVLRLAGQRHSGLRGFTPADFRKAASEVAGADLSEFFVRALETTEELDYGPALEWFGLRFKPPAAKKEEDDDPKEDKVWLGLVTRNDGGRLVVSEVRRGEPGFAAGLNVDDEIVAVGDFRVTPERWDARMEQYKAGETVPVLVARRERLLRLEVVLAAEPKKLWRLQVRPDATAEQRAHLQAWLQP